MTTTVRDKTGGKVRCYARSLDCVTAKKKINIDAKAATCEDDIKYETTTITKFVRHVIS